MHTCRILIVEDEAIVALDIEDRLTGMGYQVAGRATTCQQALDLTDRQRPDLVLMDIRLQKEMDGITAAEEVRRRFHVPVIFLTAYSEDMTLARAKLAEPYGYILKPFDDRELKSAIEISLYKHHAEEEIRYLNRLYDVLSQVNQAVVRVRTREELFSAICRVVVERGGIDLAWIGWLDPATAHILPVAHFGQPGEILSQAAFFADDRPEGQGNPGKAFRAGQPFVCNACNGAPCLYPANLAPARFGFQSCGAFPLRMQGKIFGVLTLCVSQPGFFGERKIELLNEVAMDISYALDKIEGDNQRLRLNEELQHQSRFLDTLMEAMPYPVFYKDAELRYLGCNAAFEKILGVRRDEIVGKTVYEIWPQDLADIYHRADLELLVSPGPQVYESKMQADDGGRLDVLFRKATFRNPDGSLGGIIGAIVDITQRKQAEEALIRAKEAWERTFDAVPDLIAILDDEHRIVQANRTMARALGMTPQELAGRKCYECMHGSSAPPSFCPHSRLLADGAEHTAEVQELGRHFQVSASPLTDPRGNLIGSVHVARDITERKQAEADMQERLRLEERLSRLAATVPGVIYAFRMRADGSFSFPYASPAIKEIFGPSPEELRKDAAPAFRMVHPDDLDRLWESIRESAGRLSPWQEEFRVLHAQKGEIWVEGRSTPEREADGGILWHGFMHEITERKRAEAARTLVEAQLRQAQKMESLGTLAGGIAHDFNNILGIIVGYTELASWEASDGGSLKPNLQEVLKAAQRARDLVQQILAFSRSSEQERKPVQLGLIVEEAMKMLRASLPSTIDVKMTVDTTAVVMADATQMHQVLMNLCANAAYAMQEQGGVLAVRLTEVRMRPEGMRPHADLQPGPYVKLQVTDTGQGIPSAVVSRIFDPFFTTKEPGLGTGLGLAVVHGIVRSHGGAIEVQTVLGQGTTFRVLLPVQDSLAVQETAEGEPLPTGQERILVVDDEPALTMVVKRMLEHLGYRVDCQTSSVEALEVCRRQADGLPYQLVITDMTMPQVTGLDLARELHRFKPQLPIILLTGFSDKVDPSNVKNLGIQGFLFKPIVLRDLAGLVRRLLDDRPA